MERVMGCIIGYVEEKGIGSLAHISFLNEVQGKVSNGVGCVEGFTVQVLGNFPLASIEPEGVISSKVQAPER